MKVELRKNPNSRLGSRAVHWTASQPFIENLRGVLIHRPKNVVTYKSHWGEIYLIIGHWCGSVACGSDKFTFWNDPPKGKILCARCEDEAVKEGLPSADKLVGRHVHTGGVIGYRRCCPENENKE